jgi:adenylate cyclase
VPDPQDRETSTGLDSIVAWLGDGAPGASRPEAVLDQLCRRLVRCGLPLHRVAVFVRTLHPNVMGRRFLWLRGKGVERTEARYEVLDSDLFLDNPLAVVFRTAQPIRRHIADPECPDDFQIIGELRAEGVSDYLVQPLTFTNGEVHAVSWTTKKPGGFGAADLTALSAVRPALSRLTEIYALRRTAASLLETYVGRGPGERILKGRIRRGDTDSIQAVLLLSDLRDFTPLSGELPGAQVIELLNAYFDCLIPPIEDHGGEVLKFLGDGLLAIFRIEGGGTAAGARCKAALAAARDALANLEAGNRSLHRDRRARLKCGLALHLGEVLYGNIGGSGRLDFTTIGPAVNLTARLEGLTGELGRTLVASAAFAEHCPDALVPLGRFALKGFAEAQEVFGLP